MKESIIHNAGVLLSTKTEILIAFPKEKIVRVFNLDFIGQFDFKISPTTNHIVESDVSQEYIVFENMESLFYKYGEIVKKDTNYYFYYTKDWKVFMEVNKGDYICFEGQKIFEKYKFEIGKKAILEKYFIQSFLNKKMISCYVIGEDTEKWEILLSEYGDSENAYMDDNFIIRGDKLFFTLLGTSNNKTICIDINTGKEIGEYKELVGWLYADENMIYNVRYGQTLVSLNVGTGELLEWDMKELLIENDLEYLDYSIWLVRNGFLYFAHNIGADKNSQLKPAKVGIINLKTKEIDWQYSLEKEYGVIGDIKVFGERLFVQTQANTLHIFEPIIV